MITLFLTALLYNNTKEHGFVSVIYHVSLLELNSTPCTSQHYCFVSSILDFLLFKFPFECNAFFSIWDSNSFFGQYFVLGEDGDTSVRFSAFHSCTSVI